MAIGANSVIQFWGSATALGNTTSAVLNGAFSDGTNDLNAWTNTDDSPLAIFALEFTTATTGTAGTAINLYAMPLNIGNAGTEDSEPPDANFQHIYLGSFPHNNPSTAAQTATFGAVSLPNVISQQIYNFYIDNGTGQTVSSGWELTVTPITYGPHV